MDVNLEVAVKKLPETIESVQELCKKMISDIEGLVEELTPMNQPQLTRDITAALKAMEALTADTNKAMGEEGDTVSSNGTMWGIHTTAKGMLQAIGGEV